MGRYESRFPWRRPRGRAHRTCEFCRRSREDGKKGEQEEMVGAIKQGGQKTTQIATDIMYESGEYVPILLPPPLLLCTHHVLKCQYYY